MKRTAAIALAGLLALWLGAGTSPAQNGIIMRALDEPVNLVIPDAPILEVLKKITDRTGLRITLDDEALGHLPHGDQTRLRLDAQNVTLREALDKIVQPAALQWEAGDRGVLITASPELLRIGRRPTFTELSLLATLNTLKLQAGKPVLDQLRQATGMSDLSFTWHITDDDARAKAIARAESRLPQTGKDYLDALAHGQGWTWYVWGNSVVILTEEMQTTRQLGARITARYQNQPLLTVLMDLARKADLKLNLDPGVLNLLPAKTRDDFTLLAGNSTVDQVLQIISGATGLEFYPQKLALRVSASDALLAASSGAPPSG